MKDINYQIEVYLKYCTETRNMSPVTLNAKRHTLKRFARETGLKSLKHLNNRTFDLYITKLAKNKINGSSINTYSATILTFVKYWRRVGLKIPLDNTLIQKQKEAKTTRTYYTEAEIERVLKSADLKTSLMIRIMFETGLRIAELTRLKITDFTGNRIDFIGKGSKAREVYISKNTLELLKHYIMVAGVNGYLWGTTLTGEPPTEHTIRKRLKRAFLEAGFPDFYPHALRHSFATKLQLKGATVAEIKEMMGHANIATTERYLHGLSGAMEELFQKYS